MKAFVAIPAMDEFENTPIVLQNLEKQCGNIHYELVVCVNQPESWWNIKEKEHICINNTNTIEYLRDNQFKFSFPIHILDRSTKGNGWEGKNYGVGWARKTAMDTINDLASKNDIIISLDADTEFSENYINSIIKTCQKHLNKTAISVPYYHKLSNDEKANRAILHYEIYMRYYALNMIRIGSPYNFTAIGSAMVIPVWAYKKAGGITPHKSGEDFYFLQKLRKIGAIHQWNEEFVYPAARFSNRVFFGTGPAMIKGANGDWSSYPIYHFQFFDEIKETYNCFPELFKKDSETLMDQLLHLKFPRKAIWDLLRKNYKQEDKFIKACHDLIDGLRILQFLKWRNSQEMHQDEEILLRYLSLYYPDESDKLAVVKNNFSFKNSAINELDELRNFLESKEKEFRKKSTYT
ncbi:hypothetical protein ACFLRZ_01965 [Bacteroidota bacterium]